MVEPVSIACGVLYAGLGKVLWDGAVKVGDQALGGLIGNRTDAAAVAIGRALHGRLLARRGLSENHDIARALRRAQIVATEFVIEAYARGAGANPPVAFLASVRAGLKAAHKDVAAFKWDEDTEAAMFASYQQAFREPQEADDPATSLARLADQTTLVAWAEVEQWADGAHAPERLKQRFFGQASQIVGFHDAWCGEVVEAMKTDERFKTIFVADKLVEIGDVVIDGRAVLDRLEDATEGVREQLGEMERWLAGQFDEQRRLHHETHDMLHEHHDMLRRIEEMVRAQGRTLEPDERAAVETTLEDVAASTEEDMEEARAGLSDEDPIALIDGLEAAASRDAAKRLRQAGAIAYAVDVERALRIYGKVAVLEPKDHWTHIQLSRLHVIAGDLTAAARAANDALASAEDQRDRMVGLNTLSDLARYEGDLPGARQASEEALLIARDLSARDPDNTGKLRDLSISYNKIGDIARAEGDLPGARKAYEDRLIIRNDLSTRSPQDTDHLRDLSVSFNKLGDVAQLEGDLIGARKAYEDGLIIRSELSASDQKNIEWLRDLAVSHDRLGDVAQAERDLPRARRAYEDGSAIAQDLAARDPKNTRWLRDLSISYHKLGDVARAEGDLTGARKAYEDGQRIRHDLSARDPKNTDWMRDLSVSYGGLGELARAEGDLPGARKAHEDALVIILDLCARDPKNTDWLRDLSVSYEKLGDVTEQLGNVPGAIALYQESLPIAEHLAALDPRNARWALDIEITRRRLAELETKTG
ncbi:MAG: hypothetical protein M3Q74_06625 [Pseudomonadota bacterium]|nr:hypothetical protein [Pseudomonadota bacterium]